MQLTCSLQECEALGGREGEHPANQREVDSGFTVVGKGLVFDAHTDIVPPPPEVLHLLVGSIQTSRIQEGQTRAHPTRLSFLA